MFQVILVFHNNERSESEVSSKETNPEVLRYCAYDSVKKDFRSASILILVAFPLMCVLAEQGPFGKRVLPTTMLVIFFWGFFIIFFARAKKFETILVSEEQIQICLPGKETINIPWSESASVGAFSGAGLMKLSLQSPGQNGYELVLSSEKLSPLYKPDKVQRFSPEQYAETGSWRVSLGRGNQKWCQKQIELIEGMKQKALSNKLS